MRAAEKPRAKEDMEGGRVSNMHSSSAMYGAMPAGIRAQGSGSRAHVNQGLHFDQGQWYIGRSKGADGA